MTSCCFQPLCPFWPTKVNNLYYSTQQLVGPYSANPGDGVAGCGLGKIPADQQQFVRLSDQQPPCSKSLKPSTSSHILMFPVDSIKSSSLPNPDGSMQWVTTKWLLMYSSYDKHNREHCFLQASVGCNLKKKTSWNAPLAKNCSVLHNISKMWLAWDLLWYLASHNAIEIWRLLRCWIISLNLKNHWGQM